MVEHWSPKPTVAGSIPAVRAIFMNNENDIIYEKYKSDQIIGGKADNKGVKDIAERWNVPISDIKSQMKLGCKIEMEHTKDKSIAMEIAQDHLWEFPDYYTALEDMETQLRKKWKVK